MFFIRFIRELEAQLGYSPDYRKYSQLFAAMWEGTLTPEANKPLQGPLLNLCQILFLQDQKDEAVFNNIFNACWKQELKTISSELEYRQRLAQEDDTKDPVNSRNNPSQVETPFDSREKISKSDGKTDKAAEKIDKGEDQPSDTTTVKRYFYPDFELEQKKSAADQATELEEEKVLYKWQDTDEYFPVSRRLLQKGWQFIRLREKGNWAKEIDMVETVKKISRENIITKPVFQREWKNREETLLILADYRGSMSPFHGLTDRIIAAAKQKGIHQSSQVYFFQNYPTEYVYKDPAMLHAVRLDEIYSRLNANFTMVLIISDAGAARGTVQAGRVAGSSRFLDKLRKRVAKITWLNPMPEHRWQGTAVEQIIRENPWLIMMPLFGEDDIQFQRIIQSLFTGKQLGG